MIAIQKAAPAVADEKVKVLFLCIGNSCRSQMAEGWAKHLAGDKLDVYSAGSKPSGIVSANAVSVMKEVGVDISSQSSKGFADLPHKEFDYVITMGCGDVCPFYPAKQKLDWQIEDPIGQGLDVFRRARDEIGARVKLLLDKF